MFYNTIEEDGDFDTYLFKLTQDLEQDTFYTTPFVYDSLCPYQIASDTIVPDDCGVIVGIEEPGGGEAGKQGGMEAWGHGGLKIWPNPASGVIHGRLNMDELHGRLNMDDGRLNRDLTLVIYDIFGREIHSEIISSTQEGGGREGGWVGRTVDVEGLAAWGFISCILKDGLTYWKAGSLSLPGDLPGTDWKSEIFAPHRQHCDIHILPPKHKDKKPR